MTLLGDLGIRPNIQAVVDNIETMKVIVQSGVGLALIPSAAVANEKKLGLLGVVPITPLYEVTIESYRPRLGLSKQKELRYLEIVSRFDEAVEE